jgi:hypothetical protein
MPKAIDELLDAGLDHVLLAQIGPDQDGFFRFFEKEPASELRSRSRREHLAGPAR